jgi:hypothetical protein
MLDMPLLSDVSSGSLEGGPHAAFDHHADMALLHHLMLGVPYPSDVSLGSVEGEACATSNCYSETASAQHPPSQHPRKYMADAGPSNRVDSYALLADSLRGRPSTRGTSRLGSGAHPADSVRQSTQSDGPPPHASTSQPWMAPTSIMPAYVPMISIYAPRPALQRSQHPQGPATNSFGPGSPNICPPTFALPPPSNWGYPAYRSVGAINFPVPINPTASRVVPSTLPDMLDHPAVPTMPVLTQIPGEGEYRKLKSKQWAAVTRASILIYLTQYFTLRPGVSRARRTPSRLKEADNTFNQVRVDVLGGKLLLY